MAVTPSDLNVLLYERHARNTRKYYDTYGRLPNYCRPTLFSEKIQWRKLFDRNPLFPIFCDKLAVREYVLKKAPRLKMPEILWTGDDPKDIPNALLPERYVVKPNHRSMCNFFVRSPDGLTAEQIANMRKWLNTQHGVAHREWAYQTVVGKLLIEEMLDTDADPSMSRDYRFHVFGGRVHVIVVEFAELVDAGRKVLDNDAFYDRDWRRLPYRRIRKNPLPVATVSRPANLEEMIKCAEALCDGLDYVRVDMFLIRDDLYFGEITIYPGSGFNVYDLDAAISTPDRKGFDVDMGQIWHLPDLPLSELALTGLLDWPQLFSKSIAVRPNVGRTRLEYDFLR